MKKNVIVITSMYPNGEKAPGQEYCLNTWRWWAKKHNVELFIFDEPIADIQFMNPIWQKWWFMEILDNDGFEYNQIATIDIDTMVRWDTPNFFEMTDNKFTCMIDNDNVNWLHQSINIYQKFFPKVKFDWTTYFNSGFLIYNETHKDLVEAIKKFWVENDQELYQIQKTKRKGNDQTPVNYMVRHMGHEINYLPKLYNMTHLNRKEILQDLMFIDTIAIGCIIQWYEVEMYEEYLDSVVSAINFMDDKRKVIVDLCFYLSQNLEQIDTSLMTIDNIKERFINSEKKMLDNGINCVVNYYKDDKIFSISDYRREFNNKYCEEVDVLMWGESDSLIPRQTFDILDSLHANNINNGIYKYLGFFGTNKMWDDSWKIIEHTDFNIPKSIMLVHEDTAFQNSLIRFFGDSVPQFIIKNIFLAHNRKNPNKRMYVIDEDKIDDLLEKRKSNHWYKRVWDLDHQQAHDMFSQNKIYTWEEVLNG